MQWTKAVIPALVALAVLSAPSQAAVRVEIKENPRAPFEEFRIFIDDKLVFEHIESTTTLDYVQEDFPLFPPQAAWVRINFVEPGTTDVQTTLEIVATPNDDETTAVLHVICKTGRAAVRLPDLPDRPPAVDVEEIDPPELGNVVIEDNAGFRDVDGNPIDPGDIGGDAGPLTFIFFSD